MSLTRDEVEHIAVAKPEELEQSPQKAGMALTRDEVEHIASLAHLALSERELTMYQEQLSAILDYAAKLQELDTDAISPTASVLPLRSVLREDQVEVTLSREQTLRNAPATTDDCFRMPPLR
jgi:aspartyl-tRNA(Asn)/glutamyl-tRNA(Gln) amidotransferase subunit C